MTSVPDHHDLMDADHDVFKLTQAVADVMTMASRGYVEREALRTQIGNIIDARRRLDDLIFNLTQSERKAA